MLSNDVPKRMKSRFATTISDELDSEGGKKLIRHMRDFLTVILDDSTRALCMEKLGEARKARTEREMETLLDSVPVEDSAQRAKVKHSLLILSFLVDALLNDEIPDGDSRFWASDLQSLGLLDQDSRPRFDSVMSELIGQYLPILRIQDRLRRAETGVLPNFNSLGITVEARAVRRDRYRWGMPLQGDDAYNPEITGTALIASVHVGVSKGLPKDFYFQMDETDIDNFMSSLAAAKLEMTALRAYLNLDAEGTVKRDA